MPKNLELLLDDTILDDKIYIVIDTVLHHNDKHVFKYLLNSLLSSNSYKLMFINVCIYIAESQNLDWKKTVLFSPPYTH